MAKYEDGRSMMVSETITRGGLQSAIEKMRAAGFLQRTWLLFTAMQPLMTLFNFSMTQSAKNRAVLLAVKVLGALMMLSLFFSAATNTTSWQSPPDCTFSSTKEEIIRNVTIGVVSLFLATGPAIVVGRLEKRKFIYRPEWTEEQKQHQIFRWRVQAGCVWFFGLVYISLCALFVLAFIANVSAHDHLSWLQAAASELLSLLVLEPLLLAILHAVFVSIVLRRGGGLLLERAKQRLGIDTTMQTLERHFCHNHADVQANTPVEQFTLDNDTKSKAELKGLQLATDSAFWDWAWTWAGQGDLTLLDRSNNTPTAIPEVAETRPPPLGLLVAPPAPPHHRSTVQALRLVDPGPRLPDGLHLASWSPSITPNSSGRSHFSSNALQNSFSAHGTGVVALHETLAREHGDPVALQCATGTDRTGLPQRSTPVWALALPPANALTPLPRFDREMSLPGSLPSFR